MHIMNAPEKIGCLSLHVGEAPQLCHPNALKEGNSVEGLPPLGPRKHPIPVSTTRKKTKEQNVPPEEALMQYLNQGALSNSLTDGYG